MSLPIENIKIVLDEFDKILPHNSALQKGMLCCIAKECGFFPKMEKSYAHTDNAKLREYFGERLKKYSEEELSVLKLHDVDFFDVIYMGIDGNDQPGDGWKFRGGGFPQTTGKGLYTLRAKQLGIDLVNHPELLNTIPVAAKEVAVSFNERFHQGTRVIAERFKTDIAHVADVKTAIQIAVNANAGWGKDKRGSKTEMNAFAFIPQIEEIYKQLRPELCQ